MTRTRPLGLTTHVLDTARGCPAAGLRIDLSAVDGDGRARLIKTVRTNTDGRTEALFGPGEMEAGQYELLFHVGAYFRATGSAVTDPPFLDLVPVRFAAATGGHYHVPLLVSPYGYVTYRGS